MEPDFSSLSFGQIGPSGFQIKNDPKVQAAVTANQNKLFQNLISLSAQNPLGVNVQSVEDMLSQFKTSLLGTRTESELDAKGKSLLQQGTDIANRLTARINAAAAAQNTPGAAAQTRRNQSLLG